MNLLKDKYKADPEGFRHYLPEVAKALEGIAHAPRLQRNPFGLTEEERGIRQREIDGVIDLLKQCTISKEEAVRAIENSAVLIEDNSLPGVVDSKVLVSLMRVIIGKSPTALKAVSEIQISDRLSKEIARQQSIFRGIILNLSWDMKLISIKINPNQIRERNKALRFVGIGRDLPDVSQRHDKYLAEEASIATP